MEILLFWSPVINFCRSGPFSFGLFWPPTLLFPLFFLLYFSSPLLKPLFFLCVLHRKSCLPSRFPSQVADKRHSFLPAEEFERTCKKKKRSLLSVFIALISLYSWSVDYSLPAAVGDTDGEPLWGPSLSSSLLKEHRERIISHLLNIRFIHNALGVFIQRLLLPLLIATVKVSLFFPPFLSPCAASSCIFQNKDVWYQNAAVVKILFLCCVYSFYL